MLSLTINKQQSNLAKLLNKRQLFKNYWPILIILLIIIVFSNKLILGQIIVTPDFGRSDALHLNLGLKAELARSLASWQLPIWTDKLGAGFSLLGESQTGIFNPFNLLLFKVIPFPYSMSLSLVLVIFLAAVGTYFFVRSLSLSKEASIIGALTFSLSGFFIVHLQHFNLVQTASYLPWQFLFLENFLQKKKLKELILLTSVCFLQITAGFIQLAVYSQISLFAYLLLRLKLTTKPIKQPIRLASIALAALVLSWFLSAIQVIPSAEFVSLSTRSNGADLTEITRFPFNPRDLLTFLNPYFAGNPRFGTYPSFATTPNQGIFWENTAYITLASLILALISVFLLIKKTKQQFLMVIFAILAALFLLVSLGKSSPTFILFVFPPFNFFRVPSRFLLSVEFCLALLAALSFGTIQNFLANKHKLVLILLFPTVVILILANVFYIWYGYQLTAYPKQFLKSEVADFLNQQNNHERIVSFYPYLPWNEIFVKKGWQNQTDNYHHFLNALDPNLNLVFNLTQIRTYDSLLTRRQVLLEAIINSGIYQNDPGREATISARSLDLLKMQSVNYIVSAKQTADDQLKLVYQTKSEDKPKYYVYKIVNSQPRFRFVEEVKRISKIEQLAASLVDPSFDPKTGAVTESDIPKFEKPSINFYIKPLKLDRDNIILETKTDKDSLILVADSDYPGWKAYLDDRKVKITGANINQKVIFIPAGDHQVKLKYQSMSLLVGAIVSSATVIVIFVIYLLDKKLKLVKRYV